MKTPTTLTWRASGDANVYTMASEGEWFARLQFNGELLVEQQEYILQRIAMAMNGAPNDWWRSPMPVETARRVLGNAHYAHAVLQGQDYLNRMKRAAWDANQPEKFGAYCTCLRSLAEAWGAEQRRIMAAGPEEWPHLDEDNSGDDMMGASG